MNNFKASIFALFIVFTISTHAQVDYHYDFGGGGGSNSGSGYSGFQAGFNGNFMFPFGTFRNTVSSGIGASVVLKYLINGKFAVGGYGGYTQLAPRTPTLGFSASLLNYGASFEYIFGNGSGPYIGSDFGIYRINYRYNINTSGTNISAPIPSTSSFGIAPFFGYLLEFKPNIFLNFNLKYNHVLNSLTNQVGLPSQFTQVSVGLIFNLGYRPSPETEE